MKNSNKISFYLRAILLAIFTLFSLFIFVTTMYDIPSFQAAIINVKYEPLFNTIIASWVTLLIVSIVSIFATIFLAITVFVKKLSKHFENVLTILLVIPLFIIIMDTSMTIEIFRQREFEVFGSLIATLVVVIIGAIVMEVAYFIKNHSKLRYFLFFAGSIVCITSTIMYLVNTGIDGVALGLATTSLSFYLIGLVTFMIHCFYQIYCLQNAKLDTNNDEHNAEIYVEKEEKLTQKSTKKDDENCLQNDDPVTKLRQLKSLLDEGIITQEIYNEKAKKYIDKL